MKHPISKLLMAIACLYASFAISNQELVQCINIPANLRSILKNNPNKTVVVKLYTNACPACTSYKPLFENLAKTHKDKAIFAEMNLETPENNVFSRKHAVGSIPTTLIFKKNIDAPTHQIIGGSSAEIKKIKEALKEANIKKNIAEEGEVEAPKKKVESEPQKVEEKTEEIKSGDEKSPYAVVESKEAFDKLVESGKGVVVQLNTQNCQYCKLIEPTFAQLARENPDVSFIFIDKADAPELAEEHKFPGYPSYLIYKDRKLKLKFTGANENVLPRKIMSALGKGGDFKVVRVSESKVDSVINNGDETEKTEVKVVPESANPKKKTGKRKFFSRKASVE